MGISTYKARITLLYCLLYPQYIVSVKLLIIYLLIVICQHSQNITPFTLLHYLLRIVIRLESSTNTDFVVCTRI